jgi:Kazal-type serine protease inhibitor domain
MMKVDRWFSVLSFAAVSCLATPTHEGSGAKDDQQGHEQGANTDESELSFVSGLTCSNDTECGRRSYCQYPTGQCSGTGTCQTRPKICTHSFAPLCGCDGTTYADACAAAGAAMNVEHEGECNPGAPCGKITCEKGLECCNASCGVCVAPGGVCTQEACD